MWTVTTSKHKSSSAGIGREGSESLLAGAALFGELACLELQSSKGSKRVEKSISKCVQPTLADAR